MPIKPGVGSKRIAAICAAVSDIPDGFAASTAAVRSAKPPVQVAPAGVGGQGILNTPSVASGKDVI